MHEDFKIAEAEYFLQKLADVANDPNATRFEASAFLSAARSVLQYALEEAQHKPRGQAWYDNAVTTDPVVKFLKEHRDINIHGRPLPMRTNTTIEIRNAVLKMSSTRAMVTISATGERKIIAPEPDPEPGIMFDSKDASRVTYTYQFKDWTGPEDVIPLCIRYLAEIKRIVADGRARGFLSP